MNSTKSVLFFYRFNAHSAGSSEVIDGAEKHSAPRKYAKLSFHQHKATVFWGAAADYIDVPGTHPEFLHRRSEVIPSGNAIIEPRARENKHN